MSKPTVKSLTFNAAGTATHDMPCRGKVARWTFRIIEWDDCTELEIVEPSGIRRDMAKSRFETRSQTISAANAFYREFLA